MAAALGRDIGYFFRGLQAPGAAPGLAEAAEPFDYEGPVTAEGREIDGLLINMSRMHRRLALELARALAAESTPEPTLATALDGSTDTSGSPNVAQR